MAVIERSTPKRVVWLTVVGLGALVSAVLLVAGSVAVAVTVRDRGLWEAIRVATTAAAGVIFWAWITRGAWQRAHPVDEPEGGGPHRWGPAGLVANAVLVLLVTTFVGVGIWVAIESAEDQSTADRIQARVDLALIDHPLTRADVAAANTARSMWAWTASEGDGTSDPAQSLMRIDGAEVADLAVDDDHAAVLIKPHDADRCVVIDIDRNDIASTRTTGRC